MSNICLILQSDGESGSFLQFSDLISLALSRLADGMIDKKRAFMQV